MTSHNTTVNARVPHLRAITIAALLAAAVVVAACSSSTAAGTGVVAVQLTDAAFSTDSVAHVDVFVVRVDTRVAVADSTTAASGAGDDSASSGGWTTLATPNANVNLLAYQNGAVLPLGHATLAVGTYQGFRLVIDPSRSSLTLKNGTVLSGTSTPNITFPSASRSGIKIDLSQPVVVIANDTTTVLVDFVLVSSFVMRGNSIAQNGLIFKPVVNASVR